MARYSNLLDTGLTALSYIRQRPTDGRLGDVMNVAVLFATLHQFVLITILAMNFNGDITLLVTCIESYTTYFMMIVKVIPLAIHKKRLGKLIQLSESFWKADDFPEVLEEAETVYKFTYYWMTFFKVLARLTMLLFYVLSFINRELLLLCYVPTFPYGFYYVQTIEYCYSTVYTFYIIGFDSLYVAFCAHLVVQLKILNWLFTHISSNDPEYLKKMTACIKHHRFLLEFAEEVTSVYTISLMGQYIISVYLTCMELYLVKESTDRVSQLKMLCYIAALMAQLAQYCFPATEVTEEASNLANSVYGSNWYDAPPSIQRNVRFIMMRSQKDFIITAGGMANINREAFTVVLKASMSFYTLLQQLKEE